MKTFLNRLFFFGVILLSPVIASAAQTLFVTGQLKAGLHEEKSLDSPIVKVVPTGTSLEIIKREDSASFVREPGGASGWIDNSYLVDTAPGGNPAAGDADKVQSLQAELDKANKRIETLIAQTGPVQVDEQVAALTKEKEAADQQYKSERIKVGELQVQLAELRKRLGQNNDADALYKKIDKLTEENKQLEIQLARAKDNPAGEGRQQTASLMNGNSGPGYWRNVAIAILVTFLTGVGLGVYGMDIINRRRHGGFRV